MPRLICWFLYVEYHMLASYYKFTVKSAYMPISVPVSACSVTNLTCQLQYTCIYMPAHECLVFPMSCQVSLYVNLSCYISNCGISVYMRNALFHILYAECNGLYAKLHMLDCNMPNAMTIAMSFSMTTEQVGHIIIYISIIRLWLSILPLQRRNYYYITMASVYISALKYTSLLAHQVIKWYLESRVFQYADISWHEQSFSMPTYHGMSKVLVCRHIMASTKIPNHRLFWFASISRHLSITHIAIYFGMPAYHDIL
jgi:hypothetical protein